MTKQMDSAPPTRERRTLKISEWPRADRLAWEAACSPSDRLKKGGSASHLAPVSQEDIATRYGLFLGFLKINGTLDTSAPAASHVTPKNVDAYNADLARRVRSVTAWNCIYKLRRAAQLVAPTKDFSWLIEIENDLAFVMEPKSKLDRVVFAERLVEAGLTLVEEAKQFAPTDFVRARGIRNGLMLALLTVSGLRRKNFATLEIGNTFKQVRGTWWVTISATKTKTRQRREERLIADWLNPYIGLYLDEARPVLLTDAPQATNALWISTTTRGPMTVRKVGSLITQITEETLGIAISPHLFRTADATTAADARGDMPHLASAFLGHTDPKVTEEHYNRASSLNVGQAYAEILQKHYGAQNKMGASRERLPDRF
jgi:site-specific recombinase XerD